MLHQPVHIPGCPTKLTTACNGPWKILTKNKKQFHMTHIDTGISSAQDITNLSMAPEELVEGDYDDRFQASKKKMTPKNRVPRDTNIDEDQMMVVSTGKRNNIAQVMEAYPDGSCMIQWYNTKRMDGNKNSKFYPSWYDPSSRTGEVAAQEGEVPTWEIVYRKNMVLLFSWDDEAMGSMGPADGGRKLPDIVRAVV